MTLKRICLHWTAGALRPNPLDLKSYHFVINGDGEVLTGTHKPETNIPPLNTGKYAAHCGGGNSHTIGVALAGGPKGYKFGEVTKISFEAGCKLLAELCDRYDIPVTPETVYTHYEFGLRNPLTSSRGKPDINNLPWEPDLKAEAVGDHIRTKVRWYQNEYRKQLVDEGAPQAPVPDDNPPSFMLTKVNKSLPYMTFSDALKMLKQGEKVSREGWNGKGMFIFLREGRHITGVDPSTPMGGDFESLPHLCMRTADGKCCVGWLASQVDILSDDWFTVS